MKKKIESSMIYKKKSIILQTVIKTRTDGAGWDITRQNVCMKISTWKFPTYEDREGAADKIYDNCGGSDAYEKDYYDGSYIIHILSDCTDVTTAVKFCRGFEGVRIDW